MTAKFDILVVDDNPLDAQIFQEVLQQTASGVCAHWVASGEEALRYLSQEGKYERVGPVKLVLLDINMPGLNGFETLTLIRSNPDFSRVPVVLLSSTMAPAEIDRSYSLGGNSFLHKPTSLEVYVDQVRTLVQYWLHFAQLPSPIRRRNA